MTPTVRHGLLFLHFTFDDLSFLLKHLERTKESMKLFKNYATLSDYNSDKISISKDNLTYVQNGVSYTTDSPEGITSYNVICFINDKKIIKKNNIDYDGVDATRYLRSDEGSIIRFPRKASYTYIGPIDTYTHVIPANNHNAYFRMRRVNNCITSNYFNGSYIAKALSIDNYPGNYHPQITLETNKEGGTLSYIATLKPNNLRFGHINPDNPEYYDIVTDFYSGPDSSTAISIAGTYNYSNLSFIQHFNTNRWPYMLGATNKSLPYTAYNTSVDPTDPSYTYIAYTNSYTKLLIETGFGDGYKAKMIFNGWSNYDDLINGYNGDMTTIISAQQIYLSYYNNPSVGLQVKDVRYNDEFSGFYIIPEYVQTKTYGIKFIGHTNQELPTAYTGTVHIGNEESSNYSYVCPLSDDGTIPEQYVKSLVNKITSLEEENASILRRLETLEAMSEKK